MSDKKPKKKPMIIPRKVKSETENSTSSDSKSGIILASSQPFENDPFKLEMINNGYEIVSENEYGVIVKKAKGKPTFMARTNNGYLETKSPNTIFIPDSINTKMKIHIASLKMSAQQYIIQLIMKDLKENNII